MAEKVKQAERRGASLLSWATASLVWPGQSDLAGLGKPSSCVRAEARPKGLNGFSKPTSATLPTLLEAFLIMG